MASPNSSTANGPMSVDLLDVQQLSLVKKQLEEELEHLSSSFTQLHAVQNKFKECLSSIKSRSSTPASDFPQSVLVPLTNSLYVRGVIPKAESVLVDIGTGFLVEKSLPEALQFYDAKVDDIGKNLRGIDEIIQRKTGNLRTVEDALRQKIMEQQAPKENL